MDRKVLLESNHELRIPRPSVCRYDGGDGEEKLIEYRWWLGTNNTRLQVIIKDTMAE